MARSCSSPPGVDRCGARPGAASSVGTTGAPTPPCPAGLRAAGGARLVTFPQRFPPVTGRSCAAHGQCQPHVALPPERRQPGPGALCAPLKTHRNCSWGDPELVSARSLHPTRVPSQFRENQEDDGRQRSVTIGQSALKGMISNTRASRRYTPPTTCRSARAATCA